MIDVTFDNPAVLYGLGLAAVVALAGVLALGRQRRAARRFADPVPAAAILPARAARRATLCCVLTAGAVAALVVALAGPRWGERATPVFERDAEVVILLDVSRSMLAQDVAPSRLERAKLAISEDLLPALGGERVGLVVFAGAARALCPLTFDSEALRRALDLAGPHSARLGGSLVGDGMRAAGALFTDATESHRLVVLLTDGEDQGSFPEAAAAALWNDGRVRLVVVALGNPTQGQPIPLGDGQFLEVDGRIVHSRANLERLAQVARAVPGSLFLPAATGDFDVGAAYRQALRGARLRQAAPRMAAARPSQLQWFSGLALLLLAGRVLLPAWPGRARAVGRLGGPEQRGGRHARAKRPGWARARLAPVAGALLLVLGLGAAGPETVREWIARGNAQYRTGEFSAAGRAYEQAATAAGGRVPEARFNQALARYRLGEIDAARRLWESVQSNGDARFEAHVVYNLGNCDYAAALDALDRADLSAAARRVNAARARYCDALRLDARLDEARTNLELAGLLLRRIEKEAESQAACENPADTGVEEGEEPGRGEREPRETRDGGRGSGATREPSGQTAEQAQPASGERRANADRAEGGGSEAGAAGREAAEREPEAANGSTDAREEPMNETLAEAARWETGEERQALTATELEVRITPAEAERLLQRLRDARQQRLARQRAQARQVELDSLRAPAAAGY